MNFKWHWGTKLLVAMILFMLLLIGFMIMSMRQTYFLVEKDYYPKAIEYQDKIDKIHNAEKLQSRIRIDNQGDYVDLQFPRELALSGLGGEILFYRPSDRGKDVVFDVNPDSSYHQRCDVRPLEKGKYILKIDYFDEFNGYYQEETILIKMY